MVSLNIDIIGYDYDNMIMIIIKTKKVWSLSEDVVSWNKVTALL